MIRVLIADDHPFVRAGVAALLTSAEGIELVGQAVDGAEVVRTADALKPDVILMDVDMPEQSGFEATRDLTSRYPALRVIILSVSLVTAGGPDIAAEVGAVGYMLKGQPGQLVEAVRTVAAGGTAWPPDFVPRGDRPPVEDARTVHDPLPSADGSPVGGGTSSGGTPSRRADLPPAH